MRCFLIRKVFFQGITDEPHNFELIPSIEGPIRPDTGMIVSLAHLDQILRSVIDPLDGRSLNHTHLHDLAKFLGEQIQTKLTPEGLRLSRLELGQDDATWIEISYD